MTSRGHHGDRGYTGDLVDRLKLELKQTADVDKRVSFLHAISRLMEKRPPNSKDKIDYLASAWGLDETSQSLAWDFWRNCKQRKPQQLLAALSSIQEDGSVLRDQVSSGLWLSRISGDQVGDTAKAQEELDRVRESAPDNIGVACALAEFAGAKGNHEELTFRLEEIANNTSDTRVRAALLTDIAAREHGNFSDKKRVLELLEQALDQTNVDCLVVSDIVYLSGEIGDFELQERALIKMTEVALDGRDVTVEAESELETGRAFDGFERGETACAMLWLKICQVREQRLARPEDALVALEKAISYLPDQDFLEQEKVRLLEVCQRPHDALAASSSKVPGVFRAQLALAAGRSKSEVVELLLADDSHKSSIGEALAEIIGEVSDSSPDLSSDQDVLLRWFQSHPRHPDAASVAERLTSLGLDFPALRLCIWENTDAASKWPDVITKQTDESWPLALEAVATSGEASVNDRAEAYANWSSHTSDLTVSATLLSIAARLHEREGGDKEVALEHFKSAGMLSPEVPEYSKEVLRLMHSLGKWEDLGEQLADQAAVSEDDDISKTALFERAFILERALEKPFEAQEVLADMLEQDPEDISALLFLCQVAFRIADWRLFTENIAKLSSLCPEDEPLLNLTEGEVHLFQLGNFDKALHCFERAAAGSNETVAKAARRYVLLVYYELGDQESLLEILKSEAGLESGDPQEMWLAELFETGRVQGQAGEFGQSIDGTAGLTEFKILWELLAGAKGTDESANGALVNCLNAMANQAADEEVKGACLAGAALLKRDWNSLVTDDAIGGYLDSKETLWHVADNIGLENPHVAAEVYKQRASMAQSCDDPEWVDWILDAAHALELTQNVAEALAIVKEALERSPDNPGLLEAKLRYAKMSDSFDDIVDAHKCLAEIYVIPREKALHLTLAARVMANNKSDFEVARDLSLEALEHHPDHDDANNVLIGAYKALGDEESVAQFLESKIGEQGDHDELTALYEEQADQKLAMDDETGAIEALDNLLAIEPDALSARLTKIEILIGMERFEDAAESMREYVDAAEDPVEIRTMVWRGADLISTQLEDVDSAFSWLESLVESGDRHPSTLKKIADIARETGKWEACADALGRLAELQSDIHQRIETWREEAGIRLEYLFDDDAAISIVDNILKARPSDIKTLEMCLRFRSAEDLQNPLEKALESTRTELDENPVDVGLVGKLRRLAEMAGKKDLLSLCDDVLLLLAGEQKEPWPGDLVPGSELDSEDKRRFFVHPSEKRAPSRVAGMASEASAKALSKRRPLPDISKKTLIDERAGDSIKAWVTAWAKLLGYENVDVHRINGLSCPAEAVPKNVPAIAIAGSLKSPLPSRHRFSLARNLWRSTRGLGAFEEGDTTGPVRWVIAITVAILGERIELPMPTDTELVTGAKKAMPRRLKRSLTEPCNRLLKENRQSLRAWSQAISFSADRFGLLAATQIAKVIPCIVEETAGDQGMEKFREDPGSTIMKIPRCRELLRFTLSQEYLAARKMIGLQIRKDGGNK